MDKAQNQPKILIIIIHYNTPDYLEGCFKAILKQTYKNIEIIFIDNNSPDSSGLKWVRKKYADHDQVIIVENKDNLGYTGAANQGIRMAIEGKSPQLAAQNTESDWPAPSSFEKADYVVITNPDIRYTPEYFEKIIARMERKDARKIAAITGKVYKYDFANSKPTKIVDTVGLIAYKNRRVADDGQGLIDEGQFDEECKVFGISGACPLYRVEALEDVKVMGEYFDNDFFMYKEDVDLSWRFLLYGWDALYFPEAIAYHGRGTGIVRRFTNREILKNRKNLSKFQKHYGFRNQLLMQKKNETWGTFFHDFFYVIGRKILTPIYITLFEPYLWKAYLEYFRLAHKMRKKHKIIMQNVRISSKEMSKWFKKII